MAIAWGSWASLGKPPDEVLSKPFAGRNQDGRLEVFVAGQDGAIWHIWQVR